MLSLLSFFAVSFKIVSSYLKTSAVRGRRMLMLFRIFLRFTRSSFVMVFVRGTMVRSV